MTPSLTFLAQAFRSAVEEGDFPRAEAALHKYVAWFRLVPRTLQEVEAARDLFDWGVHVATVRKAHMAGELMFLTRVFADYAPLRRSHTWRLDG